MYGARHLNYIASTAATYPSDGAKSRYRGIEYTEELKIKKKNKERFTRESEK
jgi:hypothetical protein